MRTGSTLVRVSPHQDSGWDIREPGSGRVLAHVADETSAVVRAQGLMTGGGRIQVLDGQGFLRTTYAVPGPADRPWWYVPPSPLRWVLGVLFLLQGVLGLAAADSGLRLGTGAVFTALGLLHLALVVASRRRTRRLVEVEDAESTA